TAANQSTNNLPYAYTLTQTLNGDKPFINVNGIDLEVLDSIYSDAILISNPVTYINCDKASVSVDLLGTPFFFSSDTNYFESVRFWKFGYYLK
ncbi:hypothetical protein Godav_025450, partial [Gossypium davidsonii]|nr:hypothetical protein [Gossypium davidsonii]